MPFFIVSAVRTSNLTYLKSCSEFTCQEEYSYYDRNSWIMLTGCAEKQDMAVLARLFVAVMAPAEIVTQTRGRNWKANSGRK
jgi:hypothetical protein